MSKELEALECLENAEKEKDFDIISQHYDYNYLLSEEAFNTIKQALLELKAIKETEPNEALEDLQVIENNIIYILSECDINDDVEQCLKYAKTKLSSVKQFLIKAEKDKEKIEKLKQENTILHIELSTFEKLIFKKNKGE